MPKVALIADTGESFGHWKIGDDEQLFELISDANVACGFHAGDPRVMERTIALAVRRGVSVGAHPGFQDLVGFGRRVIGLSRDEVRTDVLYQLGALDGFARAAGLPLRHVTVHGRLDNIAGVDADYATAIVEAIASFDRSLIVVAQDGALERAAIAEGLPVAYSFMADRAYEPDGQAVSRDLEGAVLHDTTVIAARTIRAVIDGVVEAVDGTDIPMPCDAVLVHGDTPEAVANARLLRSELTAGGVEIASLSEVLAERHARA